MRRLVPPQRWLASLAAIALPVLSALLPLPSANADVAPRFPNRPPPRIVWQEVKPIEPVL